MEINLHLVFFEELQENPDHSGAVTRIVVLRDSKGLDLALGEGAADF
jgi:hypothetical protein